MHDWGKWILLYYRKLKFDSCIFFDRLLDSMKMPGQARSSGFHICDILDLNDAKVHGDPSGNISASTPISGKILILILC